MSGHYGHIMCDRTWNLHEELIKTGSGSHGRARSKAVQAERPSSTDENVRRGAAPGAGQECTGAQGEKNEQ